MFWAPAASVDVVALAALPSLLSTAGRGLPDRSGRSAEADAPEGRHLLTETLPELQLWLLELTTSDRPLAILLPLDETFAVRAAVALELWRRLSDPRAPAFERLTPQRRARLILGLRALDGRLDGASYREIARVLFGPSRVPDGRAWKTHELRSRTLRLVADATAVMRGGYRKLLLHQR